MSQFVFFCMFSFKNETSPIQEEYERDVSPDQCVVIWSHTHFLEDHPSEEVVGIIPIYKPWKPIWKGNLARSLRDLITTTVVIFTSETPGIPSSKYMCVV